MLAFFFGASSVGGGNARSHARVMAFRVGHTRVEALRGPALRIRFPRPIFVVLHNAMGTTAFSGLAFRSVRNSSAYRAAGEQVVRRVVGKELLQCARLRPDGDDTRLPLVGLVSRRQGSKSYYAAGHVDVAAPNCRCLTGPAACQTLELN